MDTGNGELKWKNVLKISLRGQMNNLAITTEWVVTKDRFPASGQHVLIAILNKPTNAKWHYSICYSVYEKVEDNDIFYGDGRHHYRLPEYWMPLPEDPPLPREYLDVITKTEHMTGL
jgi:hypothetical protein